MRKIFLAGCVLAMTTGVWPSSTTAQNADNKWYVDRQERLLDQIPSGTAVFTNMTDAARGGSRNAKYFRYLTPFPGNPAYLILQKGNPDKRILVVRPASLSASIWSGDTPGIEEAVMQYGVDEVWPLAQLDSVLISCIKNDPNVYLLAGSGDFSGRIKELSAKHGLADPVLHNPAPILDEMRVIKDQLEISYLRKAIDITCEAHRAALQMARPGVWEYQVQAVIEYTYRFNGADGPGFTSIVGSGPRSCILHYSDNNQQIGENDLLLMDIGAAWRGYIADVTRTIPPSGKFSPEQRVIYDLVLKAQKAAIATMLPGRGLQEAHNTASDIIIRGLYDLGLVTDTTSAWQRRLYILYENSHYIGLDVHDVGNYGRQDPRGRDLLPGMVLTIEPGIYLHPLLMVTLRDQLKGRVDSAEIDGFLEKVGPVFEKYKGIGVRIEDDILITETGQEILSASAPKEIAEIERR